jgi:hypothetical protein
MGRLLINAIVIGSVVCGGVLPAGAVPLVASGRDSLNVEGLGLPSEDVGYWRRQYRRHGYPTPYVYYPPAYGYYVPTPAYPPAYAYVPPYVNGGYPPPVGEYGDYPPANGDEGDYPPENGY